MPFDPKEFFAVAQHVAEAATDATLRSAINRAYYSVFLVARDRLRVDGTSHGSVITATREAHRAAGEQLGELFRLRVIADYNLDPVASDNNWPQNWKRAEALAKRVRPSVEALVPPPRG